MRLHQHPEVKEARRTWEKARKRLKDASRAIREEQVNIRSHDVSDPAWLSTVSSTDRAASEMLVTLNRREAEKGRIAQLTEELKDAAEFMQQAEDAYAEAVRTYLPDVVAESENRLREIYERLREKLAGAAELMKEANGIHGDAETTKSRVHRLYTQDIIDARHLLRYDPAPRHFVKTRLIENWEKWLNSQV